MIPISINNNMSLFKKGVFDTIKLFKVMYQENRNILLFSNNKLYINNVDQLLIKENDKSGAYNFGINFVLDNIKNFRDNICINPILYLLCLEIVLKHTYDLKDLNKYKNKFKQVSDFLKESYELFSLNKVDVKLENIEDLFSEYKKDKFLDSVIKYLMQDYNTEIQESTFNNLVIDKYYRIKANLIKGSLYGGNYKIFITDILYQNLYNKLLQLNIDILILCTEINCKLIDSKVSVFKIGKTTLIQKYEDICLLTGYGKGFYNLDIEKLNNYSFGNIKDFKFIEGILYFSVGDYLKENDGRIKHLKKKDTMNRYYMLQGKNLVINVQEEYMEKVRCIVSLIKSLKNSGIFYSEIKTLKLLLYKYKNTDLYVYLYELAIEYLKLKYSTTYEAQNKLFQSNDNVFQFTSLDYYLNIFNLLDSNINILSKLY